MAAEDQNHLNMFPCGGKHLMKSVKPPVEDPASGLSDFHEEDGDPTVLIKANPEKSSDFDNLCKKKPASEKSEDTVLAKDQEQQSYAGIFEDIRAEIQATMDKFEADINKAFLAQRRRIETFINPFSEGGSIQKSEQLWTSKQDQMKKYNEEYSQKFKDICQQWELDMQQFGEVEENLINGFEKEKQILNQLRTVQKKRLMTMKQLFTQHKKSLEDVEKKEDDVVTRSLSEFRKEGSLMAQRMTGDLQKNIGEVKNSLKSITY